jgi:hypothetical protein
MPAMASHARHTDCWPLRTGSRGEWNLRRQVESAPRVGSARLAAGSTLEPPSAKECWAGKYRAMARVLVALSMSLDGCIAGANDADLEPIRQWRREPVRIGTSTAGLRSGTRVVIEDTRATYLGDSDNTAAIRTLRHRFAAVTAAPRSRCTSRSGGSPNSRLYSRVK